MTGNVQLYLTARDRSLPRMAGPLAGNPTWVKLTAVCAELVSSDNSDRDRPDTLSPRA